MNISELHSLLSIKWVIVPAWRQCCEDCMELAMCLSSDCPNRISWRRWLRQTFISHSLEAEKSRVKVLAWPGLVRTHFWGAELSWCPRLVESRVRQPAALKGH